MAYDDLKAEAGRRPFNIITERLEKCALKFGDTNDAGTCTATGEACHQGWATCKAPDAYVAEEFAVSYCDAVADMPSDQGFLPFIVPGSIKPKPGTPDPTNSLGERGKLAYKLLDAPHDDVGIDPYVAQRAYDPLDRGTYWPRFRQRFPYYMGRIVDWYSGYLDDEGFSWDNFKKRTYVIEKRAGWGRGDISTTAKDPLKLADNERSQFPQTSRGELAIAIAEGANPTAIEIVTADSTEYNLEDFETFSAVRIGDEVFKYTGVTVITDGVRLTGCTTTLDDGYSTETEAHDVGDEVQKCIWYRDMRAVEIVKIILERGASVPSAFIPYTDWEALYDTWLPSLRLTRLVTEPEGARGQIDEIIPQSMTWAFWWDEVDQQIKYDVVRPVDVGEAVQTLTDDDNLVSDSVDPKDEPDELVNETYYAFGQRDPTEDEDESGNYRKGWSDINGDSQSAREIGERRSKTIWCRWHPVNNQAQISRISKRVLAVRAKIPFRIDFQVDRKDDAARSGQFMELTTAKLPDATGAPRVGVRVRVLKAEQDGDTVSYTAREDFFRGRFGRAAPSSLSGLLYADASQDHRERYAFVADSTGKLSDGTDGYQLL